MPLTINYVWLGDKPLGAMEKFNIYSWRALGHDVTIYAHRWDGQAATAELLEVPPGDVTVVDLVPHLKSDNAEKAGTLPKTRELLLAWLESADALKAASKLELESIYNVVDLTKSYIGGSRPGIVLDTKVGPSQWLSEYEAKFYEKFISYTRAGKTMGDKPENQCIGTMNDDRRADYAAKFEKIIEAKFEDMKSGLVKSWFNLITGYHGDAAKAAKYLDVATKDPNGNPVPPDVLNHPKLDKHAVSEPGNLSHGPFRVFKPAHSQTNQSGVATAIPLEKRQQTLAQEVYNKQLYSNSDTEANRGFVEKAKEAMGLTDPKPKAPNTTPVTNTHPSGMAGGLSPKIATTTTPNINVNAKVSKWGSTSSNFTGKK
jgi:hypothetical protein